MRLLLFAFVLTFAGCKCKDSLPDAAVVAVDAGPAKRVRAVPPPGPCAPLSACLAACDGGQSAACYEASRLWVDPADGGRDLAGAQRLAAVACEKGDGRGCVRASVPEKAGLLLPAQCEAGQLEACELLVNWYRELDAGVQASEAFSRTRALATRACEAGDPFACARLGSALLSGWLGTEDPKEAARLLDKACEGGVAGACIELGLALAKGRPGLDPDPARSARLRSAARELSAD